MMRNSLKDKFRLFLYHRIPLLVTVLMMFFFYMPINFFDLHNIRPVVGFICVYYWTIKRRSMFGYVSAFFVGFLHTICLIYKYETKKFEKFIKNIKKPIEKSQKIV